MKKTMSVLLLMLFMLVAVTGCGGNNDNSSAVSSKAESSNVESSKAESSAAAESEASQTESKGKEGRTLNIFTWEGMFSQELLGRFTEETGIKINYSNFDTDENMLAKLETAKGGDYDLVIADDYIIETVIGQELAQKLDKDKIPGFENINPVYQGQFFDPQDEYTVPFGAGVQTIVYNPQLVDFEIKGYEDLWNEKLADSLGIVENFRVVNGMALKTMGESYNTEDITLIEQAGEKLNTLAPNIRLIKDMNIQDDLISGEISAAVMYTSQVTMAKMADPELEIVFPEEGNGFGIMAGFIPVNAPDADAAHEFIEFILKPENGAEFAEYLGYYCTNIKAEEFINEEYKDFLTLPEGMGKENMEMIENISTEALDAHQKVWTSFRAESGQ